jgi:hypothetical protein
MLKPELFGDDFDARVIAAGIRARRETLAAGVPVFYRDSATGLDLMEYPDGRRFEIRYVAGASRESNYQVLREIGKSAA